MIEFSGYLNGAAEKHFHKKAKILGQKILLSSVLILLPAIISISIRMKTCGVVIAYCSLFIIIPLLVLIPKRKKERVAITPKKVFTEGEYIICVADKYTESRLLNGAKLLRDFGEFYEIVFPFGKISDKFICQKDLCTQGTLEEFEALFEGKIVRL